MAKMADYSDHLNLMNSVLSLAFNLESYPNHLFNAGYKISIIGPRINAQGILNPDIFFISEIRGLFAECKTGNLMIGENIKKYSKINTRHLVEKGIDIPSSDLDLDVAIFGYDNLYYLNNKLLNEGIEYPQVLINNKIYKKFGRDFKDLKLKNLFSKEIEIKSKPLIILKFDENSSQERVAPFVFQELMARSMSSKATFTTREFTEDLIGEIWLSLDSKLQQSINNKVKDVLTFCKLQREIRPYLAKRDDVWTIKIKDHWKSKKKFSANCEKVMGKLNQCTLINFDKKRRSPNRKVKP